VYSPDGALLVTASCYEPEVRIWEPRSFRVLATIEKHRPYGVWTVNFSPDGRSLAIGSADQTVSLWNVQVSQPQVDQSAQGKSK